MRKKLIITLLLPLLLFVSSTQVCAQHKPEPDRECSITFSLQYDGTPLDGGSFTLYRVGEINSDGDKFVAVNSLSQEEIDFGDLQDPSLAKTMNELAIDNNLHPYTADIINGQAVFTGLKTGVYVVSQLSGEKTSGFAAINPFLVSLPQWQDNAYVYDLTASPKVELVPTGTEPTEPKTPTEPDDVPDLPQTGQLNWPVPMMAVAGLALFLIGWKLFFASKRRAT